jgi:hypothetical protein
MIPKEAKRTPLRPLALGEATGHHHSLTCTEGTVLDDVAEMYELTTEEGVKTYLRITADGVSLGHQEHKPNVVEPGEYEVIIQREQTEWGAQRVSD